MVGMYLSSFSFLLFLIFLFTNDEQSKSFCSISTDSIKKTLKEKKEQIKALDKMHIEISPSEYQAAYGEELCGIFGSFRKLEVD